MKSKKIVICSSVALLHLVVIGGSVVLGGCTGVQEDEPLPKGAYIPQQRTTAEDAPAISDPEQKEPTVSAPETVAVPETAVEPKTEEAPVIEAPGKKEPSVPAEKAKPVPEKGASKADLAPLKGDRTHDVEYTVKKGDSYWKIARMYGVSTADLVSYNRIPPEKLLPGKKILIPASGKKVTAAAAKPLVKVKKAYEPVPANGVYIVKKGDSFYRIAQKFGIPAREIAEYNRIPLTKSLQVNQKLKLPTGKAAESSVKAAGTEKAKPAPAPAPAAETPAESGKEAPAALPSSDAGALDEIVPPSLDDIPAAPSAAPTAAAPANSTVSATVNEAITQEVINKDTTVADLAKIYGFTEAEIRAKNPGLPADGTVKSGTTIIMP